MLPIGTPVSRTLTAAACGGLLALCAALEGGSAAAAPDLRLALSEIAEEEAPPPPAEEPATVVPAPGPVDQVPLPDPIERFPLPVPPAGPAPSAEPGVEELPAVGGETGAAEPIPEILYDTALLPEPVRRMRERIMEACRSGDPEALRPLLGIGPDATQLSFGDAEDDPIAFLRSNSGDGEGQEILAILYEVLEAGFAHLDPGTPEEIFVWPYFFAVPLDGLTAPQRVELFKIVTAGDYDEMKNYGAYNFYRAGISPEGEWVFFVAGD